MQPVWPRRKPGKTRFDGWNQRVLTTFPSMAQTLQRQIIGRARAIIADEINWTSKALARDRDGLVCEWDNPRATKFCALGALVRAASQFISADYAAHSIAMQAARQILESSGLTGSCLPMLNDSEGHAAILILFDSALSAFADTPARAS